jgi:preprotein translocase subunit SecF
MARSIHMKHKFILALFFAISPGLALAVANVCVDPAGKKTFSETSCEKKGLKQSTPDFPVVSSQSVQAVYVVTSPDASNSENQNAIKPNTSSKIEKKLNTWAGYVPITGVMLFLLALMPIAAILFLSFHLLMYVKARFRKFVHVRTSMPKSAP